MQTHTYSSKPQHYIYTHNMNQHTHTFGNTYIYTYSVHHHVLYIQSKHTNIYNNPQHVQTPSTTHQYTYTTPQIHTQPHTIVACNQLHMLTSHMSAYKCNDSINTYNTITHIR